MCPSSKDNKVTLALEPTTMATATTTTKLNNGRRILQPTSNRALPTLERKPTSKKVPSPPKSLSLSRKPINTTITTTTRPSSPKSKSPSPRPPAIKRASNNSTNDSGSLNSSSEKVLTPRSAMMLKPSSRPTTLERKKSKSFKEGSLSSLLERSNSNLLSYCSSLVIESPGSIAAVRKEQMALQQKQRKMKIAHYGRSKSANFERVNINNNNSLIVLHNSSSAEEEESLMISTKPNEMEEKRCSFITPNSDPIYVAYHDEEWGVPVHDDKMLLELLVLSGAQVGSDWTSILKKRHDFRKAFSEFDAETVANLSEKQIISITSQYGFDISRVRGVVDNANRILQIKKEFGSLDKYIWGFVNNKPISTQYKFGHKIPVKTSKSESISKDMIRRGFRFVGPTVVHLFMQAAGLTNDHLITCHRHLQCTLLASPTTIVNSSH